MTKKITGVFLDKERGSAPRRDPRFHSVDAADYDVSQLPCLCDWDYDTSRKDVRGFYPQYLRIITNTDDDSLMEPSLRPSVVEALSQSTLCLFSYLVLDSLIVRWVVRKSAGVRPELTQPRSPRPLWAADLYSSAISLHYYS